MKSQLSKQESEARILTLEEAADHLDLDWTDDAEERRQGQWLSKKLRPMVLRIARHSMR